VILEASAAGKPSVSVQVGSVGDMIEDGVSGFIVPQDDITALADRLVSLLSDDDLRRRMGAAARQRVEARFRLSKVVAQYMDVYREASRSGGKR
jgi:glycosyltransferase involved in cell wall biosynthesis